MSCSRCIFSTSKSKSSSGAGDAVDERLGVAVVHQVAEGRPVAVGDVGHLVERPLAAGDDELLGRDRLDDDLGGVGHPLKLAGDEDARGPRAHLGLRGQMDLGVRDDLLGLLGRHVGEREVLAGLPLVPVDLSEADPVREGVVDDVLEDQEAVIPAMDRILAVGRGLLGELDVLGALGGELDDLRPGAERLNDFGLHALDGQVDVLGDELRAALAHRVGLLAEVVFGDLPTFGGQGAVDEARSGVRLLAAGLDQLLVRQGAALGCHACIS